MRRLLSLCLLGAAVFAEPTPEEAWSRELVEAVSEADVERIAVLIDFRALLETATRGGPEEVKLGFVAGAMNAMRQRGGVLHEVIPDVARGGRFDLLRVTERDGQPCARFRFAPVAGGISYLDARLLADENGAVRATDIFNHMSGEWMSDTMRRFFLPVVRIQKKSAWQRLMGGEDKDWIRGALETSRMVNLKNAGRHAEALKVFEALPEVVRKQKSILAVRLQIAQELSEEEYEKAMREYLALHPDDSSAHLVAIDAHFMAGRFDDALASVAALDKGVGGDPYLDILRSNLYTAAGKFTEARKAAEAAIRNGPDWLDARFALLELELKENRFPEVLKLLLLLERKFGWVFGDLSEAEAYVGFVKSPEYKVWLER